MDMQDGTACCRAWRVSCCVNQGRVPEYIFVWAGFMAMNADFVGGLYWILDIGQSEVTTMPG